MTALETKKSLSELRKKRAPYVASILALGFSFVGVRAFTSNDAQAKAQEPQHSVTADSVEIHSTIDTAPKSETKNLTAAAQTDKKNSATTSIEKDAGQSVPLFDEAGRHVRPSSVVSLDGRLFFLGPKHLWGIEFSEKNASEAQHAFLKEMHPPNSIGHIPVQEFSNFVACPPRKSLIVLTKSGDLLEFSPGKNQWTVYRANFPSSGSPHPDYVDLAFDGQRIILIDPERNQIWTAPPGAKMLGQYFREVMPWLARKGDNFVGDGLGITWDGVTYLMRKNGSITKYSGSARPNVHPISFPYRLSGHGKMRPSRFFSAPGAPLYIVERENNRVISIDKKSGQTSQFIFPKGSDLRGLLPVKHGFTIINGDKLTNRMATSADPASKHINPRGVDSRLDGFALPILNGRLPAHQGVFPGARRLYRYGIHSGVDFFNGGGSKVAMGTPAHAAESGKIVRIDRNFRDMDAPTFNRVMTQCAREHQTSDSNEDLFRGCQVWIDHGNRVMTKYAHLTKVNASLKDNSYVNRGDVVGFVGVSGTGQNLPGQTKYPHLHFEVWLDGHYLGWGLTPGETLGVYEDIFGSGK